MFHMINCTLISFSLHHWPVFFDCLMLVHLMTGCRREKMCCTTSTYVKQLVFHTCLEAWALRNNLFNAAMLWRDRATFFHLTLIRIIQNSKTGMKCHGSLSHVHTCDISWARGLNSVYSFGCVVGQCLFRCLLQTYPHLDMWLCVECRYTS